MFVTQCSAPQPLPLSSLFDVHNQKCKPLRSSQPSTSSIVSIMISIIIVIKSLFVQTSPRTGQKRSLHVEQRTLSCIGRSFNKSCGTSKTTLICVDVDVVKAVGSQILASGRTPTGACTQLAGGNGPTDSKYVQEEANCAQATSSAPPPVLTQDTVTETSCTYPNSPTSTSLRPRSCHRRRQSRHTGTQHLPCI